MTMVMPAPTRTRRRRPPIPAGRQVRGIEALAEGCHALLEHVDPDEDEAEPCDGQADGGRAVPCEEVHQGADADEGQGDGADAELQSQQGDEPARARRSDGGAEDHARRLAQREEAGADEADGREHGGAGGLDQRREGRAGGDGAGGPAREPSEHRAQCTARGRLEAVGEEDHPQEEQPDAAEDRGDHALHDRDSAVTPPSAGRGVVRRVAGV
jgi:hypothetical protein